ncbi:MAG TPA: arsinothricin resistance N-acetyltransferase ArsN1 family B [Anaeromyxobacter sp.]|nr:arsinothricin resistance N-acetyltransferase ArsN1 family B [Anaeromyxobacter sp.]
MTTIRMATPDDGAQVAEIYRPIVAETAISFEEEPPTAAEMARRIEAGTSQAPWLACESGGRIFGYAYASRHRERAAYRWSVDVSVYVREAHRRTGVGRALYTSLFALLRLQGFCAAHAGITLPNPASVRLHESMGFRPAGVYPLVGFKQGAWRDVGFWQLALRERRGDPPVLLGMKELLAQPGYAAALASGVLLL